MKTIKTQINELGPWYQKIIIDGIPTGKKRDVNEAWKLIQKEFPINYSSETLRL